jgi:hypothetical protein
MKKLQRIAPVQLHLATDRRQAGGLFNMQTGRMLSCPLECELVRARRVLVRNRGMPCRVAYLAELKYRGRRYSALFKMGRTSMAETAKTLLACKDKRVELYTRRVNFREHNDIWVLMVRVARVGN